MLELSSKRLAEVKWAKKGIRGDASLITNNRKCLLSQDRTWRTGGRGGGKSLWLKHGKTSEKEHEQTRRRRKMGVSCSF